MDAVRKATDSDRDAIDVLSEHSLYEKKSRYPSSGEKKKIAAVSSFLQSAALD